MPIAIFDSHESQSPFRFGRKYDQYALWMSEPEHQVRVTMCIDGEEMVLIRYALSLEWWIVANHTKPYSGVPPIGPFETADDAMLKLKLLADM